MSDESELGNQSEMESFNESDSPDEADPDVVIIHDIVHLRASTTGDYSQSEIGKLPEQNTFFLPGRVKRNISSNDSDVIIDEDEIPDGAIRITSDTHFIGSSRGTSELGDFEMDEQEFLNITIEENGNEQELEEHLRNAYRHEEEECFEEEDDIIELPPLPVKPAVKKPRRKLPKHLSIESGSTAKTSKLVAEVVHDHPRPVNYRMKPAVTDDGKVVEQKRTRVTRNIMSHTIPQYHLEGEETEFGRVKESTLSKTIEQYLQAGKLVSPKCDQFREQIVATAVEYDGSVKMLQFENALKKHSGKQKRLKYQTGWWKASKSHYERAVNGYVAMPKTPVLSISDDPVLYKHHSLFPKNQSSELEKINVQLRIRLNSKRQNNDVIPDSSYFVREFLMQKHSISLRMNRSSDLPELFVPPTLECGYFPQDAVTVQQQEHYLMMRFEEAQDEYHNITYRSIAPPVEFQVGTISAKELHKFHRIGRHIHGFFVVWENKFPEYDESGICCPRKRYLVDMFNLICFPLYTEYEQWESRLRVAFDKTIVYNLHLSEILRCNRPVFDFLSKNKSMLQPITLKEIVYLIEQSNMDAKSFAVKFGLRTFYDHGRATSNKDYLSAFLIITGGAKVVTEEIDSERLRVFNSDYMESGVLTSSGDVYTFEFDKIPNNYQISIGCNADGVAEMEQEDVRHELSECSSRITRIIGDSKKPEKIIARPLVKTNQNDGMKFFTRKDLLNYRIKLYDPSYVVPRAKKQIVNEPAKKKPGRKSKTRYDAAMQQNNFEIEGVPSDVDSEFEGYLSDSENVFQKPSKLMRSTSSDSVFIDYQYREKMFLDVSWFHQQKMIDRSLPPLKKRKRKMNRIYHKHSVRYTMLQANGCAFTEMYRCYDKILPCGTKEIARTKNAIRFPHRFRTYNIPQVYGPGDKQLITEVFGVVKDVITRATGFESASIRTANDIAQAVYDANIARRELLENLEPSDNGILPSPAYLAIEMLSHQKMSGRLCLESARKDVQNNVDKMYNDYMDLDPLDKELHFEISQSIRQSKLNESLEEYERNRERQLAKTLKTVPMDKRSQAALARREEKRRESRRKLADKYAEQRRMMASTRRLEKRTTQKQVDPETIQRLRREDEVRKRKRFEEEDRRGMIRRREERVALQEKVDRMLEEGLRLEKVREAERIRQQQEEERIEMETILISRRVREEEEEKMRLERLRKAEREREQERLKREEEEERKRLEQLREAEKLKAEIEKENERKLQEERTRKALELERKIEEIKRVSTLKDMFGPLPIAKENEQTEKDFQILLDDHELTLLTISRDPLNEKYQEARTEFERLDIKSMLLRKAEKLIDVLTIHYDVPIEQTCRYFTSSIESNENRMAVNEQLNKLFENMANCFTFNIQDGENGLQSKRKWDFQFKKCAVFDGVSQSTVNFIEEKMRENTKKKHLATPKTVISIDTSLLKQSLLRSHARFDPDISLYAQNHTANSIGDVTLKMSNYSLDFATQSIHDKELAEKATPKKGPTVRRHIKNLFGSEKVIVRRSLAAGKPASLNSEDSDSEDSREGSPVAEFLPTNPVCSFWKLVVKIENSTTDKEKTELCEDLDKLILRKDDLFSKSLKWMFPLLATFYVLLSNAVLNENEEIISDKNQTGVTKDEILKSTINDLMIIAAYFEEGSRERSNLRKMISMNGFSVVFNRVILFAKKTCTLAKELESNSRSLSGYVIEDLFESLLAEIERTMRQELGSSVRKTGKLERDFEEIVKLIQNEKKLALSHKSHKNDENRRFRLNTVVKWYDAIICHCKEELTQAIVDAFPLNAITKNKETSHVAMENGDDEAMLSDTSDNQMSTTDYQMPKNICRNSEIFPEDAFAKAYAVVRIPSKKERAQMLSVYRKKNAQSGCVENKGLSRMPKFEEPFVDSVWRTIEKRINNMTHSEEKQIKRFIPVSRSHKLNEKVKFYAMVMIQERDSRDTRLFNSKFQDDNLWHCYSKSSLNHEKMESRILQHIEHTVLSKSNFNQMKWSVQCVNGNKKDAIHYFTDLYKYRSESEFRSALSCGKLKFNFKVYTHLWFMGNLLPTSYNPDSHDDKLFVPCSGCTSGDVIIIHKCTCAYHNDTFSDKFIYANTSLPVGIDKVTRLVGRFVCEHGPSSFLILEHCSANVDANIPFESENVEFSAELRIVKRKTMHSQLVKTFAEEHTHLRDASRHRAISTVTLDSSGSGRSTRCEIFEDSPSEDENDENQLDTTRIGRKIDPIIVDSDKAYLIAEGERMALRIKRLLDPELQKFRSKNFVSRSKSVDAPKTSKQKTVIRRSQSVCDLNDVNEYAQKKVRNTKDSFATLFRDHEYSTRRTYEEQLNNELLDVVTTFGGASNVSADKKYNILASILAFEKEVQLVNDKNGELFKTVSNLVQRNSLQHVKGVILAEDNQTLRSTDNTSEVFPESKAVNEYLKFEIYKRKMMVNAKLMADTVKDLKLKHAEYRPFAKLIATYDSIFKFNVYLFEHFLNCISKHVFNPYAIYCEETRPTGTELSKFQLTLKLIETSMPTVLSMLFNTEPLRRQLSELSEIHKKVRSEDLACTIASLCRYAIERIRIPQTADKRLCDFSWLNSAEDHRETVSFIRLTLEHTLPDMKTENEQTRFVEFLKEAEGFHFSYKFVEAQCKTFVRNHGDSKQAFFTAFYNQNEAFYGSLQKFMSNGTIDPKMKLYYQHQAFLRLHNIVKKRSHIITSDDYHRSSDVCKAMLLSEIVSNPKIAQEAYISGSVLDRMYTSLCKIKAKMPLISPSYIGTSLTCFEDELLFSAVREAKVHTDTRVVFRSKSCMRPNEKAGDANFKTCKVTLLVNLETALLSMVFKSRDQSEIDKDDRLDIDILDEEVIKPIIDWNRIFETFIQPTYNTLFSRMEKRERVSILPENPLGRLENYAFTNPNQDKDCQAVLEYIDVASDTDAEESIEDPLDIVEMTLKRALPRSMSPSSKRRRMR